MIRHRVHRVLVRDGAAIVGVLSQLDLMSFVSNHSHLIALQIEQAESIADLKAAALQLDGLVALLHGGGVKIEVISSMVRVLNAQVFARLWSFVAPADLVANSCLLVMGSEGRGEQILKTDQDNALLLRDGYDCAALPQIAEAFNAALIEFGWPRCPGDIMLTNPLWRAPLATFRERIRNWIYGNEADAPMHLAIFMDAAAVAGDAGLLHKARQFAFEILPGNDAFLARFAAAADQFDEPSVGWWARLTSSRARDELPFDLKKLGTFPIVHGVRALALQAQVTPLSTAERLRVLVERRRIDADLARDLTEALHFMMGLKLKNNLAQRQAGRAGGQPGAHVGPEHAGARPAAGRAGHHQALPPAPAAALQARRAVATSPASDPGQPRGQNDRAGPGACPARRPGDNAMLEGLRSQRLMALFCAGWCCSTSRCWRCGTVTLTVLRPAAVPGGAVRAVGAADRCAGAGSLEGRDD